MNVTRPTMILSFLLLACCGGATPAEEPMKPPAAHRILSEDTYSPLFAPDERGVSSAIHSYSYDHDRIRIIIYLDMHSEDQSGRTLVRVIEHGKTEIFSAILKDGAISPSGDQTVELIRIHDNTRFYPFPYEAYLLHSRAHDFVMPLVFLPNEKGRIRGLYLVGDDLSDDLVGYFTQAYNGAIPPIGASASPAR